MRKGPWWTGAAAAAAVLMLACGSGGESSRPGPGASVVGGQDAAPAGPPTVALGSAVVFSDSGAEVSVVVAAVDAKAKSNNQFDRAERGQFVAITVEATAVKGSNDIGPSNFRFVGGDGNVFQAEIMVAGIQPQLDSMTTIQQGQKKSGKVIFDCDPAKIPGGKIQLSDDSGDPVGYWTF